MENGFMFISDLTDCCVTTWTGIWSGNGGFLCPKIPMAPPLHQSSRENCWYSIIRGKKRIFWPSIAVTGEPFGARIAPNSNTDGPLLCVGVTTGSTRLLCWEVTSILISDSWHTTLPLEPNGGG